MALVAIAMSAAFVACSDDDEGIGKTSSKGKRLVSFSWDEVEAGEESVNPYTWNVTYDSDGRVVALISPNHVRSYYYTWGNNTLREEWYFEGELEEELTYYITNGLVSRYTVDNFGYEISYEYDSHDRLVSVDIPERGDERRVNVLWEDGLFVKFEEYDDQSSEPWLWTNCYYNGQTCSGYNPLFLEFYSGFDCFHDDDAAWFAFVYPEMFGLRTNALPYMLEDEYGRRNITYEFDKDNYITKVTDGDSHYAMIYCFEWE